MTGNAEWYMLCCTNRITLSELCFVYERRRGYAAGGQHKMGGREMYAESHEVQVTALISKV